MKYISETRQLFSSSTDMPYTAISTFAEAKKNRRAYAIMEVTGVVRCTYPSL
jgi:hypothetical protein